MKKKRWSKSNLFLLSLFILGLLLAAYPFISDYYYRVEFDQKIQTFDTDADGLDPEELARRMNLARAYNRTLDPGRLADPYTKEEKEGRAEYAKMLEMHAIMGHIAIPCIDVSLPVYAGTADSVLSYAAGHLEGTSLPVGGMSTHAVITAHRGLPQAKLFRDLDKLQIGDVFYFKNIEGTLAYKVDRILTVEPDNFEPVLVVEGKDYMTLLTCTPYMINSHRLLVRGVRTEYVEAVKEEELTMPANLRIYKLAFYVALGLIILLILIIANLSRKYKKLRHRLEALEEKSTTKETTKEV
uniref:class C sortase n=1 Tax=Ndongobacter massiliensis TaxID=1871025 RepID=UPI000931CF0C|nr:class C sortase [Ndongobacter massiliensis]